MFSLKPTEKVFIGLFEQAAGNVHEGAKDLAWLLEDFREVEERARRIKDIEHAGDKITHTTIEKLNKTFITPLDREDIHELICRLDDILDLIDESVSRMVLYKIGRPTEDAIALGRCVRDATKVILGAVPLLRDMKNGPEVLKQCILIHTLENEADRIEQHALAALFDNGHDAIDVIKWKDIYQDLESATDRCEDVANVLEGIVLKHA